LLLLHAALIQAVTSVVRPTASYRAIELDTAPALLGVLPAGFAVLPLVAAVAVGRIADRRGERPMLVVGGCMVLAATIAFAVAGRSLAALVVCSALLGLGHLLVMIAEQSLVADLARTRSRDAAFGAYAFASSAGQAVGPAALAVVGGDRVQPPTGTLFLAGVGMAALLLAVAIGLRGGASGRALSGTPSGKVRDLLRVPGLPAAVMASLVAVSAVDVLAVYLPALGTERGLAASTVGLLLVLRALSTMASRLLLAAAVERVGRSRLLMAGAVAAGAALVVLALPVPVPVLVVAVLVAGIGLGVGQPLTMSWVTLLAPERQRATAVSLRLTGNRLGQTVVPVVVGSAAAGLGAGGVLAATGTLLAGVTVVSARRVARTGTPERDDEPPEVPDPGDG
jgi:MFS family permease